MELIPTERMVLRPLLASDRQEFVRVHSISAEHFRPWTPATDPEETLDRRFEAALERARVEGEAGTSARRIGILADGRIAGWFNLSQIFRLSFQNAYAGWVVAADCIGLGLATEGVTALLDLAFAPEPQGLGLHRVQANVIPRNAPSVRVAEKVGFRLEGRAKDYLKIAGEWEDHLMYAKVSDEHSLRYLVG